MSEGDIDTTVGTGEEDIGGTKHIIWEGNRGGVYNKLTTIILKPSSKYDILTQRSATSVQKSQTLD